MYETAVMAGLRIHSKALVKWYQFTWRHKRNNSNLYSNLREYLTSYLSKCLKEFWKRLSFGIYFKEDFMYVEQLMWGCMKKLSVFQWSTEYWFSVAIFAGLLRRQMLNVLLHKPHNFLVPLCFVLSSLSSSFRAPCYSLRPSIVLHGYYVSIQFQHIIFSSFQNYLYYFHFFSNYFFSNLMARSFFQLFSWSVFLYITIFLTFNPLLKFPNRNLKYFE